MGAEAGHLVIRGKRVVTPSGVRPAAVLVRRGLIAGVVGLHAVPRNWPRNSAVFDAKDSVVMPGLVDTHVHVNEPGRAEWEGFATATRAAAAGGTTTIVDMPLNAIPATTTIAGLRAKRAAAFGKCHVDVGFWGGVVPGNTGQLRKMHDAGALGFKCFLVPSGVAEFPCVTESDLHEALPVIAALRSVLLVHAELPGPIEAAASATTKKNAEKNAKKDPTRYSTWMASRPATAERGAIAMLVRLSRTYGARIHIVHLADAGAAALVRRAKSSNLPVSVETCPHYLFFGFTGGSSRVWDTRFKCAPPIRDAKNRDSLWAALGNNIIDFVVSDHSPCPPELKELESGDFFRAWGGIASLELRLPVTWTAARKRGFGLTDVANWLASKPATLPGLEKCKGSLAKGCDADIVIWNPDATFIVDPEKLYQRHPQTPYESARLFGVVETTFVRGVKVFDRGVFPASPMGKFLERPHRRRSAKAAPP